MVLLRQSSDDDNNGNNNNNASIYCKLTSFQASQVCLNSLVFLKVCPDNGRLVLGSLLKTREAFWERGSVDMSQVQSQELQ